jgi:hypothetical protein
MSTQQILQDRVDEIFASSNAVNDDRVVDFDFPDSTTVRITSNAAQNLKIRVV